MGGSSSSDFRYALPIGEKKDGESRVYRNPSAMNALYSPTALKTVKDLHVRNFSTCPKKPYLGYRPIKNGEMMNAFEFYTYEQVEQMAKNLGAGIIALDLCPEIKEFKDYALKMISFYSKNNKEVWILDVACALYNISIVPIYDTLGESSIKFVFDETNLTTCFLTVDKIKSVADNVRKGNYKSLKNIVILDDFNLREEAKLLEGLSWYTLSTVLKAGKEKPLEVADVKPTDIYCFSYTSGTTGDPKGVMISHDNIMTSVGSALQQIAVSEYIYLSYLPLAHIYEKLMMLAISFRSGRVAMFNGNVLELKTDLALLKPTVFASVPRLYSKFYEKINEGISKQTGIKKTLITNGIKTKLENFRKTGDYTHKMYDVVFSKFREILGGKVEIMISGSAPLTKEIHELFTILMSAPLINGYGQTECMGAEFITAKNEGHVGIVGGPISAVEFKLLDIPDMEYLSTDMENGQSCPRGEILVRGKPVFVDYYKQTDKYAESVDADGWLHSGDIGKILPGSNALQIIDRRKNIFKLAQGEYIAPDKLENSYKLVKAVADIFVYGDSLKSVLVAIINPEPKQLLEIGKELKIEGTPEQLMENEEVKKYYIKLLDEQAKKSKLSGLEKIKAVHLEPKLFTDLDLITTTFKIKRHQAKKHFIDVLDKMYAKLD